MEEEHEGLRVVAVAPSVVEQLFALGLGDHLVGVGDFARWPEEVESLPKLGGLYDFRLETIVELEPDLAILVESEDALRDRLAELGIETLVVPNETLRDVDASMRAIAERFELGARGEEALGRWWSMLEPRGTGEGVRAMITIGRDPGTFQGLLVAGPQTFLTELLRVLGAENVFADAAAKYPQVGLDAVLERSPDLILELRSSEISPEERARAAEDWFELDSGWAESVCVRSIEGSHTLLAGPRVPHLLSQIEAAIEACRGE